MCGVLVGWSRIALGVHFPSDVLAAALLGTACACGVYTLAGRVRSLAWAP
ncbi:MAG: phosphatase PAP2 family protein [Ottowia sp.]|nr:phosphatase PAP2 family protein [Ottowia sp.]